MNKIVLLGNIVRNPESRYSENGTQVTNFSLAVNKKDKVTYFNCVAFKKVAEIIQSYTQKGTRVLIEGEMESSEYQNNAGEKRVSWKVIVDKVEILSKKPTQQAQQYPQQAQQYPQQAQQYPQQAQQYPQQDQQ